MRCNFYQSRMKNAMIKNKNLSHLKSQLFTYSHHYLMISFHNHSHSLYICKEIGSMHRSKNDTINLVVKNVSQLQSDRTFKNLICLIGPLKATASSAFCRPQLLRCFRKKELRTPSGVTLLCTKGVVTNILVIPIK